MSITGSEQWMYSSGAAGFYDFPIEQSLRFESSDSAYLTRNLVTDGNQKTFTISCWVKRGKLDSDIIMGRRIDGNNQWVLQFQSGGQIDFYNQIGGSVSVRMITQAVFRDPSSFYHIVCKVDVTTGTSANAIYVNGVEQALSTDTSSNTNTFISSTGTHYIGQWEAGGSFDGYMAEFNFIDGQALDASNFGETKSGIWIPKEYSGSYGTMGFRLAFADGAAIGDDTSGNTNDWTANNLVASDVVPDSPTNNFATMNPLAKAGSGGITFSEGNLKVAVADNGNARSNFVINSGKWYWEAVVIGGASVATIGIAEDGYYSGNLFDTASTAKGYIYINDGNKRSSLSASVTAYGASYTTNDIIGVAYDADNGTVTFYKNNTTQGTAYTGLSGGHSAYFQGYGGTATWVVNFGQDSTFAGNKAAGGNADENGYGDFKYAPPSGFLSLCSANLPTGAIDTLADETPEDYFNTVLYTGNGTTDTSITSVGFQPSLTWIKQRSGTEQHQLTDAVRGAPLTLSSSGTFAENNNAERLKSFDADGFTLGNDIAVNQSSQTYVGWNWKANGAGVSNTDGSITSTVSVGATSQQNWFSIVGYTGDGTIASGSNVGHGLGVKPDAIIVKDRDASTNWNAWFNSFTGSQVIYPNLTNARNSDANVWSATEPTSSVFYVGNSAVNASSNNYIAYCFANAEGLCKVGSYVGSAFVYTGFRPAFVLIKKASGGTFASGQSDWVLYDGVRNPSNPTDLELVPNSSQVEDTYGTGGEDIDMLSNGFKILTSSSQMTGTSTYEYIYLAIASQGFKYANAR